MFLDVSNAVQLTQALKSARSGDTIRLDAGDYGLMKIHNLKIAGNVTITSADAKNPAVLSGLDMSRSSGITMKNLDFAIRADGSEHLLVAKSSNIVLDGLDVYATGGDRSAVMGTHLALVRDSQNVVVRNSEFHDGFSGLGFLNVEKFTVEDNSFHDLRMDGLRGGGVIGMKVLNNTFTDFYTEDGDHGDAIQFWTKNTDYNSRDILVSGNVITRGNGDVVQGIFFRDQTEKLPYQNVEIVDNYIYGGNYRGLSISGANNLTIRDNVVLAGSDHDSWLTFDKSSNVTLADNVATQYTPDLTTPGLVQSGNRTVGVPTDGGTVALDKFLASDLDAIGGIAVTLRATVKTAAVTAGVRLDGTANNDSMNDSKAEILAGGKGDDKYGVNRVDTEVVETTGGGSDLVSASIDYKLGDHVENLRLAGMAVEGSGNDLDNQINGNALDNLLKGLSGNDRISGNEGDDSIHGDAGDDYITSDEGDDLIFGGDGADRLFGNAGLDKLDGGAGTDALTGGAGADRLVGGAGADKFLFSADDFLAAQGGVADIIADFRAADGDKICLNGLDANIGTAARDKFVFLGIGGFTKLPGQLRYEVKNGDATLYGDVNGDGKADFSLVLEHVTSLTKNDFIF